MRYVKNFFHTLTVKVKQYEEKCFDEDSRAYYKI